MKIIDETGAVITAPDLELGYLVDDTETIHHDAVEAVEEVSHYETVAEYPNGGRDVQKVVDTPAVEGRDAYDETVAIQRYIRYTDAELAQRKADQEASAKRQSAWDAMPETVEALKTALDDADALNVDQEYRLTLLELGITEDADNT